MNSFFKNWKYDVPSGLVVFLVAVPLCLGIALASDAPLFSGLIAGIVGGIVVGAISGSALGVSGPAAGLTAIVATAIHSLGSFELFLCAVVFAGFLQIILGSLRLGFISYYFPNVVIKGMLAAIGLIIILKQIPHAVGFDKDFEGDQAFFQVDGQNTFSEILNSLNGITPAAVVITLASLTLLLFWDSKWIKNKKISVVPGPLLVVLLGMGFTYLYMGTPWELIAEHRVDVQVSGKSASELFIFPDFSGWADKKVWMVALTLAVVASVETLLSVDAADKLDPQKRITPSNRELFAQGFGNITSGLLGGLPLTQVVVRTSANVNSGGKTKLATIFHGCMIALVVFSVPFVLNLVPYASLAAILFVVGFKLAKPSVIKSVYKQGWVQFIPFVSTIVSILLTDLLIGISIGLVISFGVILYYNYRFSHLLAVDGTNYTIKLTEHMTFLNKASLTATLLKIPENVTVIFDESSVKYLAYDIIESIEDFKIRAKSKNILVEVIPQK